MSIGNRTKKIQHWNKDRIVETLIEEAMNPFSSLLLDIKAHLFEEHIPSPRPEVSW
jgi:hypothetical protein